MSRARLSVFMSIVVLTMLAGPTRAADDDIARLRVSVRNSVAAQGKDFGGEIRGYFEAFLTVRSCNALNGRGSIVVENGELGRVRWWMHTFQSALRLESDILIRAGIRSDELWSAAERNTEPFRKRAAAPGRADGEGLTPDEIATTCRTALDVFRSGEQGGPTKLSF